ncbi:MAG: GPW/gp25 family protein [Leptolyngbya sp. SIO1E4]|nr:GPW/gp25 family protein [Leptolyngbya sp. SIO1E4]
MLPPLSQNWPLLPRPDSQGHLQFPDLQASVAQSIQIILSTRPGEQLMRPEFGAGLQKFLHEPNSLVTRRRIRDAVMAAIQRWEPRIVLSQVTVDELPDAPSQIRVDIRYQIRRTGAAQQLGLTMELEG